MSTITKSLGFIGGALLNGLSNLFESFSNRVLKGQTLDADFLQPNELLSRYNKGLCLTGNRHATLADSVMHGLVVASSGSGKSVTVLMPSAFNLAKHGNRVIIHDPAGEIALNTAGYYSEQGYEVQYLNFADANNSVGYNPLAFAHSISDIQKICSLLVRNSLGDGGKDPFWNNSATTCLVLFCLLAQSLGKEYYHFPAVKHLLETAMIDSKPLDLIITRAAAKDPVILQEYKLFLAMEAKVRANVLQTCRAALNIFANPEVARITSVNTIDFSEFRKRKIVIYIQNKIHDIKFYSVLTSCFCEQFFGSLMSSLPTKKDGYVFFLIDEFSSLYLPSIMVALSNLRKFQAGVLCVIQDYNQIKHIYGVHQAEAIRTNTYAKVYFGNQPLEICKELEQLAGRYEETDDNGKTTVKTLITAEHIRRLPKNHALIFMGANLPIYAVMKPFYKHSQYSQYATIPQPTPDNNTPVIISLPKV